MVDLFFSLEFEKTLFRLNAPLRERVLKQIEKIRENPEIGKPMRYARKGTREVYVPPYRLAYTLDRERIVILEFYHKDRQ